MGAPLFPRPHCLPGLPPPWLPPSPRPVTGSRSCLSAWGAVGGGPSPPHDGDSLQWGCCPHTPRPEDRAGKKHASPGLSSQRPPRSLRDAGPGLSRPPRGPQPLLPQPARCVPSELSPAGRRTPQRARGRARGAGRPGAHLPPCGQQARGSASPGLSAAPLSVGAAGPVTGFQVMRQWAGREGDPPQLPGAAWGCGSRYL